MRYMVFISHSGHDAQIARWIKQEIEAKGANTFLDDADIRSGDDFEARILPALKKANELVALITPFALKRWYIWMEIGAAWIRQIPIIFILYGVTPKQIQGNPDIPVIIKRKNLININQINRYLNELEDRIKYDLVGDEYE